MKWIINCFVFLFFYQCHTTVKKFKNSELVGKSTDLNQNKITQVSWVFGIYEYSDPAKSNCPKDKTKAIVIHRDWNDKAIHFLIGGIYTTRKISVICE